MFELERVQELSSSPMRSWTAISGLNEYQRWHPYVRLSGTPELNAAIGYTFYNKWFSKPFTTSARMTSVEKPSRIGWRFGLRGLLLINETYDIAPGFSGTGTALRHQLVCRGLLSVLQIHNMKARLLGMMAEADEALERYLRQPAAPKKPTAHVRQPRQRRPL